jgi:hypothetical protein
MIRIWIIDSLGFIRINKPREKKQIAIEKISNRTSTGRRNSSNAPMSSSKRLTFPHSTNNFKLYRTFNRTHYSNLIRTTFMSCINQITSHILNHCLSNKNRTSRNKFLSTLTRMLDNSRTVFNKTVLYSNLRKISV